MMDMYGCYLMSLCDIEVRKRRDREIQMMRESLSPQDFDRWWQNEETERRHRELCDSIKEAGRSAGRSKAVVMW